MHKQKRVLEIKIMSQIKQIYRFLLKYGYPKLVSSKILTEQQQIQNFLSIYFQPNDKRQDLIQWLIYTISPIYAQSFNNKLNKKNKIINALWRLGVMPYSKHTKNLDYQKYVDGLLGIQMSINLIYNLCCLLNESNCLIKSKEDSKFHFFIEQLVINYENLINSEYDPYKISFPPLYNQLSQNQIQNRYKQVINKIQNMEQNIDEQCQYQNIINNFQKNKQQFTMKYNQLINKINKVVIQNKQMIKNWKQTDIISGKILKVPQNLPKNFKLYKDMKKLTHLLKNEQLNKKYEKIKQCIQQLNNNIVI